MDRIIISAFATGEILTVLCNDGTLWQWKDTWTQLPNVPQPETAVETDEVLMSSVTIADLLSRVSGRAQKIIHRTIDLSNGAESTPIEMLSEFAIEDWLQVKNCGMTTADEIYRQTQRLLSETQPPDR